MLLDLSPIIITTLCLYLSYFKLNISKINQKSLSISTFSNKKINITNIFYFYIVITFIYFTPILVSPFFLITNKLIFTTISTILLIYLIININVGKSTADTILLLWYFLISVFFNSIQNVFLMLLIAEILFYSFLLIIVSNISYNNLLKTQNFFESLLVIVVLNFLTTFGLYLFVGCFIYQYGFTQVISTQTKFESIFIFFIILKLSNGPWFLWNLSVYTRLSQYVLCLYVIIFFVLQLPQFFFLILNSLYLYSFYWLFLLFLMSVLVNYNIYNIINIKYFLLYSSYITYLTLLLMLI